ncbi:MAG: GTPase Era [Candidatus Nanopelagicales bacterium]|nr:GTPase Era [Candidatus Nanopelagicales bacterium]MDZ4249180.1 GTPase Era [Candidatus Nanopelagicales bacterium]
MSEPAFRSGFACIVGRPNVGKSTLLNAILGTDVAATSDRPQTTRHTIRGVVSRPDRQVVIVDTPGFHRPKTLLGRRLNDLVRGTWAEVDVIAQCFPADEVIGAGDRFIGRQISGLAGPVKIALVTKTDKVAPARVAEQLVACVSLAQDVGLEWTEIVPVSAVTGFNVAEFTEILLGCLPPGPPLYPEGEITDEPDRVLVAEFIREAALRRMDDEMPHSIAVVVDEMETRPGRPDSDPLVDITAVLYVERDSQKPIVIGPRGAGIKQIGTDARRRTEALLGSKVFLDLRVKVAKDWQRDPKQLKRLGF